MKRTSVKVIASGLERFLLNTNLLVLPKAYFNEIFRRAKRSKIIHHLASLLSGAVAAVLLHIEAKVQLPILQSCHQQECNLICLDQVISGIDFQTSPNSKTLSAWKTEMGLRIGDKSLQTKTFHQGG